MAGITHTDLLALQTVITNTVRHEVGLARKDFGEKFAELRSLHDEQQSEVERHGREIARLEERSRLTSRGLLSGLTRKQKTALWSVVLAGAGVVFDGLRHVVVLLISLWAKGVHP